MPLEVDNVRKADVRCVLPWPAQLGECPNWDPESQKLYWVDILSGCIHRFDPARARNETFVLPNLTPCLALRRAGGLLVGMRKCLADFDPDENRLHMHPEFEGDLPENRINDGACDPQGRFWVGTMNERHPERPSGSLYCYEPEDRLRSLRQDVVCSNGTGWSPDGRTMYHTESFRYAIYAYDFEAQTGEIRRQRPFVEVDRSLGDPDGLAVDEEGYVWSCIVGRGRLHRYDPQGRLVRVVLLPVDRVTSCAFGGRDLRTLFLTSSRQHLTPTQLREQPLAGSLFALEVEVPGLPVAKFAG